MQKSIKATLLHYLLVVTTLVTLGAAFVVFWNLTLTHETCEQVFKRFKEPCAQKQKQLVRVLDKLPAHGGQLERQRWSELAPTPTYFRDKETSNVSFVTEGVLRRLANPEAEPQGPKTMPLSSELLDAFREVDEGVPPSDRDSKALAKRLQATLDRPYLVIVRTLKYERPEFEGFKFRGATAHLEAYLMDLRTETVMGSVPFFATAGYQVQGRTEMAVEDKMWHHGHDDLASSLAKATGGIFLWKWK